MKGGSGCLERREMGRIGAFQDLRVVANVPNDRRINEMQKNVAINRWWAV